MINKEIILRIKKFYLNNEMTIIVLLFLFNFFLAYILLFIRRKKYPHIFIIYNIVLFIFSILLTLVYYFG